MKRMSQFVLSSLLAMILGLGLACAKKPDDTKISSDIQSKFSQDSGLSSKQLTVQSNNGVVTLEGTVDNDAQRQAASRQASSVAGVKEVVNNLQVGSATAAAQPAPAAQSTGSNVEGAPARSERQERSAKKSRRSRAPEQSDEAANSQEESNQNQAALNHEPPVSAVPAGTVPAQTPPPPAPPKRLIIDQGTQLAVRLIDAIDSEKNKTGDTFHATLDAALTSDGQEAVPAGSDVAGHLVDVKSAGKFAGQSAVVLQLDSLTSGGKTYTLQTDQYRKQGSSRGKNTAEKVGGGAIIGGIIGAIAGGGKGAAIGSAAGAGVGGGVQAATKGQQIKLPSETVLNFTLQAPITVVKAVSPDANRPRLTDSHQ